MHNTLSIQQQCRLVKLHCSNVFNIKVTHAILTVQLQHVFTVQQNDPSYLLSAMFLTLFGLMGVKAVRCLLWQKLSRLHWVCESGFQAFCPAGVWDRQWSGLFTRPLQFGTCSSNLISTAACCSFIEANDRSHSRCSSFEEWRHLLASQSGTRCFTMALVHKYYSKCCIWWGSF